MQEGGGRSDAPAHISIDRNSSTEALKSFQQHTEEMTTDDLLEILVFHASVSGLEKMDEDLQLQCGGSLTAARQKQAGVRVVARAVWMFLP